MKAIRKDFRMEYDVREMTDDEIDISGGRMFCSDETGHIFRENELEFVEDNTN